MIIRSVILECSTVQTEGCNELNACCACLRTHLEIYNSNIENITDFYVLRFRDPDMGGLQ